MTAEVKKHIVQFDRTSILSKNPSEIWNNLKMHPSKDSCYIAIATILPLREVPEEYIEQTKEHHNRFLKSEVSRSTIRIQIKNKKDIGELRRYFKLYELKDVSIYTV